MEENSISFLGISNKEIIVKVQIKIQDFMCWAIFLAPSLPAFKDVLLEVDDPGGRWRDDL